jgi:GTPase
MDPSFCSLFGPETDDIDETETSSSDSELSELKDDVFTQDRLPPEPQLGNIEYKLKLLNVSKHRFEHLVTQMKWRLREGGGEAIYEIGVADSGIMYGLNAEEMKMSLNTLQKMAKKLKATTNILKRKYVDRGRSVVEVLIRRIPDDKHVEIRVCVLGAAEAGKSTMLGVLTYGEKDNGRGRSRLNIFRHMHEIQTGRTSCISHELLGFDNCGNIINYKYNEMMTAEEISDRSTKLISFIDLAGLRRYFKTTVQAVSGYSPHYSMLVIASGSINAMTIEHLTILKAFKIPFFIVITKIDLTPPDNTIQSLDNLLMEIDSQKIPLIINSKDDLTMFDNQNDDLVPIFSVSNVTGKGLDLVQQFLYILSPKINKSEKEKLEQEPPEYHIDEIFRVAEVGTVVGGLLVKGIVQEKMKMKIGPLEDGSFRSVGIVKSVHRNKAPCRMVKAGQSASLSFSLMHKLPPLRSGMVLIPEDDEDHYGTFFFQVSYRI